MYCTEMADRMREVKHDPEEVRYMCKALNDARTEGIEEGRWEDG